MVHLVCVESGGNTTKLNLRLGSGKSMMAQLISKEAGNQNAWIIIPPPAAPYSSVHSAFFHQR
jgi:hypothetical protein